MNDQQDAASSHGIKVENQKLIKERTKIHNNRMSKTVSYQDIITSSIGEMGKSQIIIILACNLPNFLGAWSMIIISFAAANVDWWRVTSMYNATSGMETTVRLLKSCSMGPNDTIVYESGIYSIVKEWNLICDDGNKPIWIKTCQMSGVFVGAAVIGQLGDWIGRKICLLFAYTINVISIFLVAFSVDWLMMIICVFFLGFSLGGFLVLQKVLTMEYIGTSWRSFAGFIPFWSSGVLVLGCVYMGLPNWRHLYILNGALGVPLLILIWFLPESIRWLFSHGKIEEGRKMLITLAKRNGLPEPNLSSLESVLSYELEKERDLALKYNYLTLFKYKFSRWRCPLFGFVWFTCAYSYYALTFEVSLLEGNTGGNMALFGFGEAISLLMVWAISKKLGRKYSTLLLFAMTSLSSFGITIAYAVKTQQVEKVRTALAIISRFFLSAAWASLMVYTVEMFPTKLRSCSYGFVSICARVGGIVAPQAGLLFKVSRHIPYTINGCLAAVSAFLVIFLHDTYAQSLQDNLEEDIKEEEGV